eukprot:1533856-Alexandrium_andersonii.AAC.1
MSASLVGSEMCIRDRPSLPHSRLRLRGGRLCGRLGRRHGRRVLRDGRPVSYTHLTLPTICSV